MDLSGWAAALGSGAAFLGALWVIIKGLLKFYFLQQKKLDAAKAENYQLVLSDLRQTVAQQKFVLEKHRLEIEEFNKGQQVIKKDLEEAVKEIRELQKTSEENYAQLGRIGATLKKYIDQTENRIVILEEKVTQFGKVVVKP